MTSLAATLFVLASSIAILAILVHLPIRSLAFTHVKIMPHHLCTWKISCKSDWFIQHTSAAWCVFILRSIDWKQIKSVFLRKLFHMDSVTIVARIGCIDAIAFHRNMNSELYKYRCSRMEKIRSALAHTKSIYYFHFCSTIIRRIERFAIVLLLTPPSSTYSTPIIIWNCSDLKRDFRETWTKWKWSCC